MVKRRLGFTIVELLIVIVVIATLAAVTIVAFRGAQDRAHNSRIVGDLNQLNKKILLYAAENGSYPSTGSMSTVYVDNNCAETSTNRRVDWIPGVGDITQNPGLDTAGRQNQGGCYAYASDGQTYVLSAWNARRGGPGADLLYRRLGFREAAWFSANTYYCNHPNIGGNATGTYVLANDFYKYSFTISNISNCNETPPAGA